MKKYGQAAVDAAQDPEAHVDPEAAWDRAMSRHFQSSLSSREKGCPKGAFLGLCEEGLVKGIKKGVYTGSFDNKWYAVAAYRLLQRDDTLAKEPETLWKRVTDGESKRSNSQMDVIISLWSKGLLISK